MAGFVLLAAGILIITTGRPGAGPSSQQVLAGLGIACLVLSAARALGVALRAYRERRPCAGALSFALIVGAVPTWLVGLLLRTPGEAPGSARSWLELESGFLVLAIAMLLLGTWVGAVGSVRAVRRARR